MFGKKNEIEIKIDGMHCERCAARVKDALEGLGCRASVSLGDGKAKVKAPAAVTAEKIVETVNALGYTATLV